MGGRRWPFAAIPATAAIVAVAAAVALGAGAGRGPFVDAASPVARRVVDRVSAVLAGLPRYPGLEPASALDFPISAAQQTPGSPELIDRHALWYVNAAPGTFGAWASGLGRRLGMRQVSGFYGNAGVDGIVFAPRSDPDQLEVQIAWQAVSLTRLAVRYDVMAIWQPPHPAAEIIPRTVLRADATYQAAEGARPVRMTLRGKALSRLRAIVDGAPVDTRGAVHCPMGRPVPAVTVRFVWPSGGLTASESAGSCADITVRGVRGGSLPALFDGSMKLVAAVAKRIVEHR